MSRQITEKLNYMEMVSNIVKNMDLTLNIDTWQIQNVQLISHIIYDFHMFNSILLYSDRMSLNQYGKYLLHMERSELYASQDYMNRVNFENCVLSSQKDFGVLAMETTTTKDTKATELATEEAGDKIQSAADIDFNSVSQNPKNNFYMFLKIG